MMKKLLSLIALICIGIVSAHSQCVPGGFSTPGIYPDTITNLPHGTVGLAYSTVVQIVVPTDTATFVPQLGTTVLLDINYFHLTSVTGLPNNFSYDCNPADCKYPGGGNGCLLISSPSPQSQGTYPLVVNVTPNVSHSVLGTFDGASSTINGYEIVIDGTVGYSEVFNTNTFQVGQNVPNPFEGTTTINYSNPTNQEIELTVYDMLGKVIHSEKAMSEVGMNKFVFNSATYPQGVYMYTVSNGEKSYTKRMIVSGK